MKIRTEQGDRVLQRAASIQPGWLGMYPPGFQENAMLSAMGSTSWMGKSAQYMAALRIAAVACAVRIVSESIASMPLRVYEGDALQRQPVYDASQALLFQDPAPSMSLSSFDFLADTAAAVETNSAAFVWKVKDKNGQVIELWPLDPGFFQIVGNELGRRVIGSANGRHVDVTNDVIVIRAWSPVPAADGMATPDLQSNTFNWARKYEEYRGRFFENDGTVHQVIEQGPGNRDARREMARGWTVARKSSNVGVLWGQATLKSFAPTLAEAQAAELATAIAQDVARAYRIFPASLMYAEMAPAKEATLEMIRGQTWTFTLMSRTRRIERAFAADRDLFPIRARYPRFDPMDFIRADTSVLGSVAHNMNQTGTINRDEERALVLGLPAIPGGAGEQYVKTPVGAAVGSIGPGAPGNPNEPTEG